MGRRLDPASITTPYAQLNHSYWVGYGRGYWAGYNLSRHDHQPRSDGVRNRRETGHQAREHGRQDRGSTQAQESPKQQLIAKHPEYWLIMGLIRKWNQGDQRHNQRGRGRPSQQRRRERKAQQKMTTGTEVQSEPCMRVMRLGRRCPKTRRVPPNNSPPGKENQGKPGTTPWKETRRAPTLVQRKREATGHTTAEPSLPDRERDRWIHPSRGWVHIDMPGTPGQEPESPFQQS